MVRHEAEIGVFGGSGFYSLLSDVKEITVETPYGAPSDRIALGTVAGRKVAFLARHGKGHQYPPHKVPYRANVWAMRSLGVRRLFGPCAAGSLQPHVRPGDFVVSDQFVDRTTGRADTFYDGPITTHVSVADPYCPEMRATVIAKARQLSIPVHDRGTVVVIQGPRFSTRAESRWFSSMGWEVINMTQYPEAILAREQDLCYVNIALITDFDAGLEGHPEVGPVSHEEVLKVFSANNDKLRALLLAAIEDLPAARACACGHTVRAGRAE
jgi:5'-methylthioadenosine phosphorylase